MRYLKLYKETIDYPDFNVNVFKSLKSFSLRLKYCNNTLDRIGYGSTRAVYMINDSMVLKLAINKKGLIQNYNEQEHWLQDSYGGILTEIIDRQFDEKYKECIWIISEYAKTITKQTFEEIIGVNFDKYIYYISNYYYANRGFAKIAADYKKRLNKNDLALLDAAEEEDYGFVSKICGIISDNDLNITALSDINKYGIVNRDGESYIVIRDYGITDSYFEK